jgi:SAM-dependent methyltransferase
MPRGHVRNSTSIQAAWFPEVGAGGFTSLDGTIEFYTRINALLGPAMAVLDFGAGRGAVLADGSCDHKKKLVTLRGKVAKVIACDIDEAVLSNSGADEAVVIQKDVPLPFPDASFDLIVADFVFEHIAGPAFVSAELRRILKRGGWICARTPNKYCLVSLATRAIHNSMHPRLLRWVQPERKPIDVYPTVFKLNSKRDIVKWFGPDLFDDFTYRYEAEPSYFFNNRAVFAFILLINRLLPPAMKSGLFVFLRRKMQP